MDTVQNLGVNFMLELPVLLVAFVGLVVGIVYLRRSTAVAVLTVCASLLYLLQALLGLGLFSLLPRFLMEHDWEPDSVVSPCAPCACSNLWRSPSRSRCSSPRSSKGAKRRRTRPNRMGKRSARPATVWLTQALLVIFSLLLVGLAAFDLILLRNFHRGGADVSLVVLGVGVPLGFALLPLLACRGLARRKLYGKWLCLLSLTTLWALLLLAQASRAPGLLLYYEHSWLALATAASFGLLINGMFLILIASLARSKQSPTRADTVAPPPR